MHLDYSQQLETKRQRVVDALERIGKIFNTPVPACVPSPNPLSYRNKIQLPVDQQHRMGLYAFNSHDIVEIEKCYIHCSLGEQVFAKLKKILKAEPDPSLRFVLIKTGVNTNQVLVILVTEGEGSPNLLMTAEK